MGSTVSTERFTRWCGGGGGLFQRADGTQGLHESNNSGKFAKNRLANPAGAVSGFKTVGPQLGVDDLNAITP